VHTFPTRWQGGGGNLLCQPSRTNTPPCFHIALCVERDILTLRINAFSFTVKLKNIASNRLFSLSIIETIVLTCLIFATLSMRETMKDYKYSNIGKKYSSTKPS
jgi:hypothetical protein